MNNCSGCGHNIRIPKGAGTLHLKFPTLHTKAKALSFLESANIKLAEKGDLIAIEVQEEGLLSIVDLLDDPFTKIEANGIKAYFEEKERESVFADVFEVRPLSTFVALIQSQWLSELIDSKSYTTYFQPIVDCMSPDNVLGYECLFRGLRGESLLSPADIFETAKSAEITPKIDLAARQSAIECAVQSHIGGKLFINFAPTAIYDPVNCLATTIALLEENQIQPERVCFEIVETEKIADVADLVTLCNFYRMRGFNIVLDDLGAGYSSLTLITQLKPGYVKIDMELIRDVDTDSFKASYTKALIDAAKRVDVQVICEGVETDGEYQWLREHGADYVQGFYFARPSATGQ
ncbi:MAG: EAL domain-containing protein [Leptolyngbyaceae cyanobacterium MAG.088]|nr:EAL domain-containing protein [Leptolyngbyaceae cyanobacterium MAG.088]